MLRSGTKHGRWTDGRAPRTIVPMTQPSHRIAFPASLLADPTRAAIVLALMDGRSRPAKKLALDAGVTQQTASAHLKKLVAANLLAWESHGRCKHCRPSAAEGAEAVE